MVKRPIRLAVFLCLLNLLYEAKAQDRTPVAPKQVSIDLQPSSLAGPLSLTLNRAIELALERNPILVVEKLRLEQSRTKIDEENGGFDPLLNLRATIAHRDNLVASRFYPTGLYVDSEQAPSFGIESKTRTGGRVNIGLDYKRLTSTSNTQTLSPQYSATLAAGFSQALLRDFGRDVATARIRVAKKGEEISERNLFQKIAELIQHVEEVYWNVTYLRQELDGKKRSLAAAESLLKQNEDLLRAGRVAPVNVTEARAGVAAREQDVLTAENEAGRFEDRLKILLWLDLAAADLTLLDQPGKDGIDFDATRSLQLALKQRPEIQALQKEVEQREIELRVAANQTLPRLDLVTQYSVSGLSGTPNPTCLDPTSLVCDPVGGNVGGSVFANQKFAQDALATALSLHTFENWSVEMKLQIPLGNRTANAQRTDANLRLLETAARLRAMRDQISEEIRNAIRETLTAKKRMDAARENLRFMDDQLAGARRQFEAGLASSYDVLHMLDEQDKARTTELRAVMDFNVGQSKVRLAEASTLDRYNVELKPTRYTFQPAFANR